MSEETKRDKFVVELEDPFEFGAIASTKFITSNDLCAKVSELFHEVFADYEGCIFEMTGNEPTISLFFNHGEYPDAAHVATEKIGSKSVGSTIIDRSRSRDRLLKEGDRFAITEDGKDVIKDLLILKVFNNGNPDFSRIASEWADRAPVNSYLVQAPTQYTKVSFISVPRICGLLFGSKDKDGNEVEYSANVVSAINPTGYAYTNTFTTPNYILNITQASSKEVIDFYNKIGIGVSAGMNIIR